jgi:hypothetical protein
MTIYKWINGYRSSVSADVVGAELEALQAENDGRVNAQKVVDVSRPLDAPMHPLFEWKDEVAAEAYRRHQARKIVRAIVTVDPQTKEEARKYVGVNAVIQTQPSRVTTDYVSMDDAVNNAALFAEAIARLEMHVQRARASVNELRAAAERNGAEPERLARIALAVKAIEAVSVAIGGLRH